MIKKRGCKRGNSRTISSKRAQVTVFIIIGILLLFAFAGILYLTRTVTKEDAQTSAEPIISSVPQEFAPLSEFTQNCLEQTSKDGLRLLGQQGGYIYPDVVGKYSPAQPTESDGINLEPTKVPYWHYNSEPNANLNVKFSSLKPALTLREDPQMSVEAQLARYIEENIGSCLNNFESFSIQGVEVTFKEEGKDRQKARATVLDGSVNFLLTMPIEAKSGEAEGSLEQFFVKVPLDLKHYYDIAELISTEQTQNLFLERQGMELISAYSGPEAELFPPTSDLTFQLYNPTVWSEAQLKQKYKGLLTSYVPAVQYLGSSNFYYRPDGNTYITQKLMDNMVLPLLGAEDLEVRFDYLGWDPFFKTNSQEGIIKPEQLFVSYLTLRFGQQKYQTSYDVSYPVLVTLNNPEEFGGEGYKFVFALESNIRNNLPGTPDRNLIPAPVKISSLACESNQLNTGVLKTIVIDSYTKEPIEGARVGFSIPEQADCSMGVTNKNGAFESKYPQAYGGVVNFIHNDYLTGFYPVDTYNLKNKDALIGYSIQGTRYQNRKVVELDKVKTVNVTIKKKKIQKCLTALSCDTVDVLIAKKITCQKLPRYCTFNNGNPLLLGDSLLNFTVNSSLSYTHEYYFSNKENDLDKDETVTYLFERVDTLNPGKGDDFVTSATVKGTQTVQMPLVPGVYKATALSNVDRDLRIPADQRCFKYTLVTRDEQECFTTNLTTMKSYPNGNLEWNTKPTYFIVTPEDLYSSNHLTLFMVSNDLHSVPEYFKRDNGAISPLERPGNVNPKDTTIIPGRVSEDLQVMGLLVNASRNSQIRDSLEPAFSTK